MTNRKYDGSLRGSVHWNRQAITTYNAICFKCCKSSRNIRNVVWHPLQVVGKSMVEINIFIGCLAWCWGENWGLVPVKFTYWCVDYWIGDSGTRIGSLDFTTVMSLMSECPAGKRRYDRKQSGYGGQTKPIFRKKVSSTILVAKVCRACVYPRTLSSPCFQAKTTKKIVLRLECMEANCRSKRMLAIKRCKHFELGGDKKRKVRLSQDTLFLEQVLVTVSTLVWICPWNMSLPSQTQIPVGRQLRTLFMLCWAARHFALRFCLQLSHFPTFHIHVATGCTLVHVV